MVLKAPPATIEDLYNEPGKAELVGGRIVREMATGGIPSRIAGRIFRSLEDFAESVGIGEAFMDDTGFTVPRLDSGRESFSPDVGYVPDDRAITEGFIHGAPTFAIEVRSETEYSRADSEADRAAKRKDYFEAGTLVVWDVDYRDESIHSYHASNPQRAITFRKGQQADAAAAVIGWRIDVSRVFAKRKKSK